MSSKVAKLANKIQSPTLESIGHALAGATAGACTLIALYPLDQIKVRNATESHARLLTMKIIIDDFIHLRIGNIMDIYRGLSFGILQQFCFQGIYFFFYSLLKNDWKRKYQTISQPDMPWLTALIRGSCAGLLTQIFTTPLKVIQIRKQSAPTKYDSKLMNIYSNILKTDGPTGFWSGFKASILLVVNPAIVQYFYENIRKYLINLLGYKSTSIDFISGALSKAIACIICYPLVLIKMNLQAGNKSRPGSGNVTPRDDYDDVDDEKDVVLNGFSNGVGKLKLKRSTSSGQTSMTDIFKEKYKEGGIPGLYSGLKPKLIHASLSNAIMFAFKEKFVVYTFALMLYIVNKRQERMKQKMTKIATKQ